MSIMDWFDILLDGIRHGIEFFENIDIGGISLADYIVVIFITSLVITLFLNVVNTGAVVGSRAIKAHRRRKDGSE